MGLIEADEVAGIDVLQCDLIAPCQQGKDTSETYAPRPVARRGSEVDGWEPTVPVRVESELWTVRS